jgi:hypothetical protein
MSEPLSAEFVADYADCCRRILAGDESLCEIAAELGGLTSDPAEPPKLPGAAYSMWAELGDACDLGGRASQRAEELVSEAAAEFLALPDPAANLGDWAEGWMQRIDRDEELWA